ncbi:hypothetical protein K440DRAFT_643511 [Wilcoxina mikolae CBS 423.85]|nr:hypothetical protein K440DRAFT_643511 [Wilcoxina mikolae CBS 423.85]
MLRAFECVVQQLTTNQVHATPAPNTVSEPNPSQAGNRVSLEPTPSTSAGHGFSVKSFNLLMYDGKQTLDDVTTFLCALEQHFKKTAQAIGWVGTTGWGEQAVP